MTDRLRNSGNSPLTELTPERAEELLAELSAYYGERVTTASMHCAALREWVRVMGESGYAPHVAEAFNSVYLNLMKSNLAHRLVYLGEPVRTEPCPKHKGHWSGCRFFDDDPCECMSGSNVTGWLPPPGGAKADTRPALMGVVAVPKEDESNGL